VLCVFLLLRVAVIAVLFVFSLCNFRLLFVTMEVVTLHSFDAVLRSTISLSRQKAWRIAWTRAHQTWCVLLHRVAWILSDSTNGKVYFDERHFRWFLSCGCYAAVEAIIRIGWNKFRQLVPFLTNKDVSLIMRLRSYSSCVCGPCGLGGGVE